LIENKFSHVVIANTDPFSEVNGKGIEKLKAAGINVTTGILAHEGAHLNRYFLTQ